MLKKLRLKIICVIMVVVTVMLCVIFGLVIHFTQQELNEETRLYINKIATSLQNGVPANKSFNQGRQAYFAIQTDTRGTPLSVSGNYIGDLQGWEFLEETLKAAQATGEKDGTLPAYQLRFTRRESPFGYLYIFVDISSQQSTMNNLIRTCILVGLLSFSLFIVLSFFLSGWAIKPVAQAWTQQQQFVADTSHELKTPLTVILTNAEMLQNPEYDEASRGRFAGNVLTMSRRMRVLVESLLELARVDNGAVKTAFAPLDYSGLVSDALLPFEPLFFERELELDSRIEEGIPIKGSAVHLRQSLEVLLDNALKYATPPGVVTVILRRHGSHCLLSVTSPGAPIPKPELKNIFKRFYRIDKARTGGGSYGLGLSIAQRIVEDHRGKIWAESAENANTFHIQLPL